MTYGAKEERVSTKPEAKLEDFAMIKLGIASVQQVEALSKTFFRYHHHLFVGQADVLC